MRPLPCVLTCLLTLAACSSERAAPGNQGQGAGDDATPGPQAEAGEPRAAEDAQAQAIEACADVATLYPKPLMSHTALRDEVVGKHWVRRDGGRGSMHGPPMLWRRNTDLTFKEVEGGLEMHYEEMYESTDEEPETKTLDMSCQICGDVMVCDQTVWALDSRTNDPPKGGPLDVLDTAAILELEDHDLYLIRHGHEVFLDFAADPLTTPAGDLIISVRELKAGAEVATETTTYKAEEVAAGFEHRYVRLELPGEVEGIRLEYRPDDRGVAGAGYGTDSTLRPMLFEIENLKKHPDLMDQPKSLEVEADAPGFNLPHR